jgi:tRNA (guanine37-N1)-methyltransferase
MFDAVLGESILKRAAAKRLLRVRVRDLRRFSKDGHRKVDDRPYGGGPGMIMSCQPIFSAVEKLTKCNVKSVKCNVKKITKIILLSPRGKRFDQKLANQLARQKHLILICGHYEGVDERVKKIVTDEISVGDYVLTGGELPAMVIIDAVARLIPGVLGNSSSAASDSFQEGLLEYPQYTRPRLYKDLKVPPVLLTGDHKKINEWRHKKALERTRKAGK